MHLLRIGGVALAALLGAAGALTSVLLAHGPGVPVDELVILLVVVAYALVAVLVSLVRPGQLVGRLLLAGSCAWGGRRGVAGAGCPGHRAGPPSARRLALRLWRSAGARLAGAGARCSAGVPRRAHPVGGSPTRRPRRRSDRRVPHRLYPGPHAAGLPADRPRQPDRAAAEPPDSRRLGRPARGGAHRGEPGRRDRWSRAPLANR